MRIFVHVMGVVLLLLTLTACLYPQGELAKNSAPNEAQLNAVQEAVVHYKETTNGLVPIRTKDNEVDRYEKYLIDFSLLKERQLLSETPGSAYENGGIYQFILLHPEDDPQVKLVDLRLTEKLREINVKVNLYRQRNIYPPFGDQLASGIYRINYKKLGYSSEPFVQSPFTKNNLPILLTEDGEIFIDYRIDLMDALQQFDHSLRSGDDIRVLLEDNYPFVPAYSLPYTIDDNNEPIFIEE